jgi:hypothetical protein
LIDAASNIVGAVPRGLVPELEANEPTDQDAECIEEHAADLVTE